MKVTLRKVRAAVKAKYANVPAVVVEEKDNKVVVKDGSDYQTVLEPETCNYHVIKRGVVERAGKFEIKNNDLTFKS